MAEKKYYWLKLKEDFFDDDTIEWIEEQENGEAYCLFYLKLCLKSLKTNGTLIRNVGELLVPYDIDKLAAMTKTIPDTARVAMNLFESIGLVQILENGEIYMTQLQNLVGSESNWAAKKRLQRGKTLEAPVVHGGQGEDNICKMTAETTVGLYGKYKNVKLSKADMQTLENEFGSDFMDRIERLSGYMKSTGKTYDCHLATIQLWALKDKFMDNGTYVPDVKIPSKYEPPESHPKEPMPDTLRDKVKFLQGQRK